MTTKEIVSQEYLDNLDKATDFGQDTKQLPLIKFSAVDGMWVINRGEKDDKSLFIFKDLSKTLSIHLINVAYQLASSGDDSPVDCYTKEYTGEYIELIDSNNKDNIIDRGRYKDLKAKYNLIFNKVLYGFMDGELVRVKLKGFGLINWFPFLEANGNPVKFMTEFKLGNRYQGDGKSKPTIATKEQIDAYNKSLSEAKKPTLNLFYEIKIEKGKDMLNDKELLDIRIDATNEIIRNKGGEVLVAVPEGAKQIEEPAPTPKIEGLEEPKEGIFAKDVPFD